MENNVVSMESYKERRRKELLRLRKEVVNLMVTGEYYIKFFRRSLNDQEFRHSLEGRVVLFKFPKEQFVLYLEEARNLGYEGLTTEMRTYDAEGTLMKGHYAIYGFPRKNKGTLITKNFT